LAQGAKGSAQGSKEKPTNLSVRIYARCLGCDSRLTVETRRVGRRITYACCVTEGDTPRPQRLRLTRCNFGRQGYPYERIRKRTSRRRELVIKKGKTKKDQNRPSCDSIAKATVVGSALVLVAQDEHKMEVRGVGDISSNKGGKAIWDEARKGVKNIQNGPEEQARSVYLCGDRLSVSGNFRIRSER